MAKRDTMSPEEQAMLSEMERQARAPDATSAAPTTGVRGSTPPPPQQPGEQQLDPAVQEANETMRTLEAQALSDPRQMRSPNYDNISVQSLLGVTQRDIIATQAPGTAGVTGVGAVGLRGPFGFNVAGSMKRVRAAVKNIGRGGDSIEQKIGSALVEAVAGSLDKLNLEPNQGVRVQVSVSQAGMDITANSTVSRYDATLPTGTTSLEDLEAEEERLRDRSDEEMRKANEQSREAEALRVGRAVLSAQGNGR